MMLFRRIKIWISVLYSFVHTFSGVHNKILNPEETVDEIIHKRKSLIRFGDGEFGIFKGKTIHYQVWSLPLQSDFKEIKQQYEKDYESCPYILALPKQFMSIKGWQLMKKRVYVSCWAQARYQFKKDFRLDIPYGDAFLFEKKNSAFYEKIWSAEKAPSNIVFVHNNDTYADYFSRHYDKKVYFVKCPNRDAYEQLPALEKEVLGVIEKNHFNEDNVMIVVSAGPAGKVLVYHLSKLNYWCIDTGHCWDDPLEGINV